MCRTTETERFITVDGDNIVMEFEQKLEFPETDHDGNNIAESIFVVGMEKLIKWFGIWQWWTY